jgi:hypothetical protein
MNPCCENLENRSEPERDPERPDLTVTRCLVCGRRHFELEVDPLVVGVKFGTDTA